MTALSSTLFSNLLHDTQASGAGQIGSGFSTGPGQADPASSRFERVLAVADSTSSAVPPPPASTPYPVAATRPAADADANERARQALELEQTQETKSPDQAGDVILRGVEKLRAAFDSENVRLNQAVSGPLGDFRTYLNVQRDAVHFNILVDVTSKLTGKATQAFDTLLKGQ